LARRCTPDGVSAGDAGTGIGAGGGTQGYVPAITLGWTAETDEIAATTYSGAVTLEKDFHDKTVLSRFFRLKAAER